MKIGILTYHASHNYGAFLQAYALQNVLKEQTGNDIEIIDFNMPQALEFYENAANPKTTDGEQSSFYKKRYHMFIKQSREHHELSEESLVTDDIKVFQEWISGKYDFIIVGSDEVWALGTFRGFPNPYWLPGVTGLKKISYAASSRAVTGNLSIEEKNQVREFLSDFSYIGVRDSITKKMVQDVAGISAHMNCDPTFVYNFPINKELGKWLIKGRFHVDGKKKCIALMLTSGKMVDAITRKYERDFDFISLYTYHKNVKKSVVLTPYEWIQVIAGCDGLISSFFHGVVFAMKSGTPFIALEPRKLESNEYSKIYDLLLRHGLENHFHALENPEEQSLRIVAPFLADIYTGEARTDFSDVCDKEKQLFIPFLEQLPDIRPNHIVVNRPADCCGCGACVDSCLRSAIKLVNDEKGFWYPRVDNDICVNCGRCKNACAFRADKEGYRNRPAECYPLEVYGVKHKDEDIRKHSRSGGVFTAISDRVLADSGAIYGAAYTDDFLVEHKRATTPSERDMFRGSKYIQSSMDGVYRQIREDLRSGRPVLFSGTPCQVAAVRKAMDKENCNELYLLDVVCHGVPSPKTWADYLEYREREHNGHIEAIDFRDKQFGWKAHRETFVINGTKYDSDDYAKLFMSRCIERISCFECPYKSINRVGDITIADFWGIDEAIPGFNDDKGVSLVLVNSEKGKRLLDLCKGDVIWESADLKDAMQNNMRFPYPEPDGYYDFWEEYKKSGMKDYLQKREQVREEARKKQEEERKRQEQAELRKQEEEKRLKKQKIKQQVKHSIKRVLGKIWRATVGD